MKSPLAAVEVTRLTYPGSAGVSPAKLRQLAGETPALPGLLCVVALLAFVTSAFAQPVPKIDSISPEWIQRGPTVDITIAGTNPAAVSGFIFSGDSGLSATNVPPPEAAKPAISIESSSGTIPRAEAPPAKDNKR